MNVCMHSYMDTYINTHITGICVHMYMFVCMYVGILHTYMHACIIYITNIHIYVPYYRHVCVSAEIHGCMCIHTLHNANYRLSEIQVYRVMLTS